MSETILDAFLKIFRMESSMVILKTYMEDAWYHSWDFDLLRGIFKALSFLKSISQKPTYNIIKKEAKMI